MSRREVNDNSGAVVDWKIGKGSDAVLSFLLKDDGSPEEAQLTGATAELQIREEYTSETAIFEGSTEGADPEIVITPSVGRVVCTIPAAVTGAFDFEQAVYDMEIIYADSTQERPIRGRAILSLEATQ